MSTSTDTTVHLTRMIDAPRERVFAAWTDPAHLRQWSCPHGLQVADAQVDLRVGGHYLLDMVDPEGGHHTAFGTYREVEAPQRLVYTWDWKQEDHRVGETEVTVEFLDHGGRTEVRLTHVHLPSVEARDSHASGWSSCLDQLERAFA